MFQKVKSFLFENTTARQTVAKNTFWLAVSNFGGKLIKAAIIIYAARVLGTAGYGLFSYAVTLAGFLTIFMDPGINSVLMRDVAQAPQEEGYAIFATTFAMKLVLIAGGVALVIFIGPLFSTLPGAIPLLPIVACILMFDTFREFLLSLVRGLEKMQWDTAVILFTNLMIVIFGFAFIFWRPTPKSLGWGYAFGTFLGCIAAMIVLREYLARAFSHFSRRFVMPVIQSAWPFAITGVLGLLLTNTDVLIISWMRTASDVGVYAAAIRIIQVLYLVPGVLQTSILPLFARLARNDGAKFRLALERSVSLLFVASVPMALGGVILGTATMSFIYGSAFAAGGLSLSILMVTMIVDYPGSIMGTAIFTYGHQKSLIITSLIGGVGNVIFDLLLIPHFGITGSAFATLIAQTISNGYLWYVMKGINNFTIVPHLKKIAAASIIMAAITLAFFLLHVNIVLNVLVSVAIYFGLLKLFREPLLQEMLDILPLSHSIG